MVDFSKRTPLEQALLRYYQIYWLRVFNTFLYFVVEICLFVILTLLPIKVTFYFELRATGAVQRWLDVGILMVFLLHVYLYLDHKVRKLVMNPQITKKILFRSYVVKLKWLKLLNGQLAYDLLCLAIAIFQLAYTGDSSGGRVIELIYLFKVYKIVAFHDRFLSYIIGTPFYILYNVFYGLFILIIIVSYVGCAFFALDRYLNDQDYSQPQLLWVNVSAWPDIIGDGFGIQLLYTMYWSLGTASSAAYGNVSAGAPEDIIYNIICLYFQGFLFGFYLSRIHSLPEMLSHREDELLQIFEQFQDHKQQIKKNDKAERIDRKLYFKILCSLEYMQYRKKNVEEIEKVLPREYLLEVKQYIFREMLHGSPAQLWHSQDLKKRLSLSINQVTTEAGELLYEYGGISRTDIIYIREGKVTTSLEMDHSLLFSHSFQQFNYIGLFPFVTGISVGNITATCNNYCNLYVLKREHYREVLTLQERVQFDGIGGKMMEGEIKQAKDQPLPAYELSLSQGKSDVHFINASRKQAYVGSVLKRQAERGVHQRKGFVRPSVKSIFKVIKQLPKTRTVGVQCDRQDTCLRDMEKVIIL